MSSHDIRNPLTAVMGVVGLLERTELDESQQRFLHLLRDSSEHMLNLVARVLDLSKAEPSSFALVETPFSLHDLVADTISTFEAAAREKGVRMEGTVSDAIPAVLLGDPIAIRQILINLVGNAVKFTSAGAVTVSIDAKEAGTDSVTLSCAVT